MMISRPCGFDVDTVIIPAHVIAVNISESLAKGDIMTLLYAACVASLGISAALGHSWLGEHKVFRPLYAEPQAGMLRDAPTRDVIRIVWHLPSIT
jgi:hypothetical protein